MFRMPAFDSVAAALVKTFRAFGVAEKLDFVSTNHSVKSLRFIEQHAPQGHCSVFSGDTKPDDRSHTAFKACAD